MHLKTDVWVTAGFLAFTVCVAGCDSDTSGGGNNNANSNANDNSNSNSNAVCGNDVGESGEICDGSYLGGENCVGQGFSGGTLACLADCSAFDTTGCSDTCGDGVLDTAEGEECDDGTANSDTAPNACRTDCTLPVCGDGVVDDGDGEECDDGNTTGGDGCSATCIIQTAPTCTIESPANGARQAFDTSWTFVAVAADAEDGGLSGASVGWVSDVLGPLGTGLSITLVLDPPYQHEITCTATDSDAMTGADMITVNAFSPYAEIWHPGDGENRDDCPTDIPFTGRGFDYEDGEFTSGLVWTSDLDGLLTPGGANFSACLSGLGANTITLTATDSDSNDATAVITLNIQ